jgi:C-terminal processing protease CtpA/Prc
MSAVPEQTPILINADLADFLSRAPSLSTDEKTLIVRQARRLFEDYYVHLVFKRAIHGVDPVQRLRVLEENVESFTDTQAFHEEMLSIFRSVRDLHTNYKLPKYFHRKAAVLPFALEEYFEGKTPHIVVSEVEPGLEPDEATGIPFARGVVVTTWNGLPVQRAIAANADRQAGCNPAGRHARGLATMTDRPLSLSPAPEETEVRLRFTDLAGATGTMACRWRVIEVPTKEVSEPARIKGVGIDVLGEETRRSAKSRLRPEEIEQERNARPRSGRERPPAREAERQPPLVASPVYPDALQSRTLTIGGRSYGHLRIATFGELDRPGFVAEVRALLKELPQDGLILDVRGNGGGVIASGEALLQLFTAAHVDPEPLQLRITEATRRLAQTSPGFSSAEPSLERAVQTAEVYCERMPLSAEHGRVCNMTGQRYYGPVVLLVDALCYSTTDIFAAGFQDHWIGAVIGTDRATGAGGASVWDHATLRAESGDPALEPLPKGVDMRLALLRTLRVHGSAGVPLEEFGVVPRPIHLRTRADVLEGDVDLMARAAKILRDTKRSRKPYTLDIRAIRGDGDDKRLIITAKGLTRLHVYVNGNPVCASLEVDPKQTTVTPVQVEADNVATLQVSGFDGFDGPVAEAAGPIARFLPALLPEQPANDEDLMAKQPFDGFDGMTDKEVRAEIARELGRALLPYQRMIATAIDRAAELGGDHAELIPDLKVERKTVAAHIDEGTQRWGKLPDV